MIVRDSRDPQGRDEGPHRRTVSILDLPPFFAGSGGANGGTPWHRQSTVARAYVPRDYERTCVECGAAFVSNQPQAMYCRPYHRQLAYRRQHREVVLARKRDYNRRVAARAA